MATVATVVCIVGSMIALAAPAGSAPPNRALNGVSCVSTTDCFAVGQSGAGALVEHWNGTKWSVAGSPKVTGALAAVSCTRKRNCFAVGTQTIAGKSATLIEHWDGASWSIVSSPAPAGKRGSGLLAVQCTNDSFCIAVGFTIVSTAVGHQTLVERWNGNKWAILSSPNPATAKSIDLRGVACISTLRCTAVGSYLAANGRSRTLIERWNGTAWTMFNSPNPDGGSGAALTSISCFSAASCAAAGLNFLGGPGKPVELTMRWDGTTWTITTESTATPLSQLNGVACNASSNCLAVGETHAAHPSSAPRRTLVRRWSGTGWSTIASQNPGADNALNAVACPGTKSCFAVGTSDSKSLVEGFNGKKWSTVPSP